MINNKKRVTLNRRNSSLLLDYQAIFSNNNTQAEEATPVSTVTNEYTRQLVASALSLPASVDITTTATAAAVATPTTNTTETKKVELPQILLKSSLRNPTKSASAPCSPTTGIKSVKFNKHNLEEICLFKKAQTPLAISQKNIFWGEEDDDEEDSSNEGSSEEEEEETEPIKSLVYANWPTTRLSDIIEKRNKLIRIEKNTIRLIEDGTVITGKILVKNLDYHKTVTIRYTFDFWETIDNISAKYQPQEDHKNTNYDVFLFELHLPANASTLYFAVNYQVGKEQYWDNNDGRNYEIQIKQNSQVKKKQKRKSSETDALPLLTTTKKETGEDLKSRYDFSTSIHQAVTTKKSDQPYLSHQHHKKSNSASTILSTATNRLLPPLSSSPIISPSSSTKTASSTYNIPSSHPTQIQVASSAPTIAMPIPIRRTKSTSSSPTGLSCHSPTIASSPNSFMDQSYLDLVNKYCFYSTSPSRSPMSING
jgi:hypothetical protein